MQENITSTRHIIRILEQSDKIERFIFANTTGAYDRARFDTCRTALTEETPLYPQTAYGKSKKVCQELIQASKIPYTIIILPLVYGPGMRDNSHLKVFINAVLNDNLISKINFKGGFSFVHVNDAVRALIMPLENDQMKHQAYFINGGPPTSLGDIFALVRKKLNKNAHLIEIPFSALLKSLSNLLPITFKGLFNNVWVCAADKIEQQAGYKPRIPIEVGIDELIESMKKNVLITGGGGGIGRELSQIFVQNHHHVYIADINKTEIDRVAPSPEKTTEIETDFSRMEGEKSVSALINTLDEKGITIHILVNNVGIGAKALFRDLDARKMLDINTVNVAAFLLLTRYVLQSIEPVKIVNIASSAAYKPIPTMAVYSATKAFVLNFTMSLWAEEEEKEEGEKNDIYCICPSGTNTDFQKNSGVAGGQKNLLSPQYVAQQIYRHIHTSRKAFLIIGLNGKIMYLLSKLLPLKLHAKLNLFLMQSTR
jgi:hypothetical protein